jgi:hypothetical protein
MGKTFSDAFDSYISWLVLFVFLTAINLAMEAMAYLVNDYAGEALRSWALWPSRVGLIAIVVAFVIWLPRVKKIRKQKGSRAFFDEYVTAAILRSAFVAFLLTLCLVAILDVVTNDTQLPADFFIKLPGLSLTAGFSISFFLFNRNNTAAQERDDDE